MANNNHPCISVIIAVYNAAPFLHQCLDSLFAQTFPAHNWELICVDDGSTDDSLTLLQQYQSQTTDLNMTVYTQANQGAGMARNHGMDRATGKYLLFLDADDYFSPELLLKLWQGAEESRAEITICRSQCFDHATGKPLPSEWLRKDTYLNGKTTFAPQEIAPYLFQFTYGWAWDKLFLREFVMQNKLQFPNFATSHDLCFVYPALVCSRQIHVIDDRLIFYRMNRTGSVSHTRSDHVTAPFDAVAYLEKHLSAQHLLPVYRQTFLNFAVEFLVWHVSNLSTASLQKQQYAVLKETLFSRYNVETLHKSSFHSTSLYLKYQLVHYAPFGIYRTILSIYQRRNRA